MDLYWIGSRSFRSAFGHGGKGPPISFFIDPNDYRDPWHNIGRNTGDFTPFSRQIFAVNSPIKNFSELYGLSRPSRMAVNKNLFA